MLNCLSYFGLLERFPCDEALCRVCTNSLFVEFICEIYRWNVISYNLFLHSYYSCYISLYSGESILFFRNFLVLDEIVDFYEVILYINFTTARLISEQLFFSYISIYIFNH